MSEAAAARPGDSQFARPNTSIVFARMWWAPFACGLLIAYLLQLQELVLLVGPGVNARYNNVLNHVGIPVAYALIIVPPMLWPVALALLSTRGDARFWGTMRAAHSRAALRVLLALVLACAVGALPWLLLVPSVRTMIPLALQLTINRFQGNLSAFSGSIYSVFGPGLPLPECSAFMNGLLVTFGLARWLASRAQSTPSRVVARWLLLGLLTGLGLQAFVLLSMTASNGSIAVMVIHHGITFKCPFYLCFFEAEPHVVLAGTLPALGAASLGGLLGGLLRVGWPRRTSAPESSVVGAHVGLPSTPRLGIGGFVAALAVGILLGACWIGAFLVEVSAPHVSYFVRNGAIALLLLLPPAVIVLLSARWLGSARDTQRARAGRVAWGGVVLVLAQAPSIYFALLAPAQVPSNYFALLLTNLPEPPQFWASFLAALGATIAIGFAWAGQRREQSATAFWWRRGLHAALAGGVGIAFAFAALLIALIFSFGSSPAGATIARGLSLDPAVEYVVVSMILYQIGGGILFAVVGGAIGTLLRAAPPLRSMRHATT